MLSSDKCNAILHFQPNIIITAEKVAAELKISIEEANNLLSEPHSKNFIFNNLRQHVSASLDNSIRALAKIKWPNSPIRRDAMVTLTGINTDAKVKI